MCCSDSAFSKMQFALCLSIIFSIQVLACGCGEENDIPLESDMSEWYWLESEPTLSPDREYIYYSVKDTANEWRNGIYRARVSNPKREAVFLRQGIGSPTASPSGEIVACLDSGRIGYYNVNSQEFDHSTISGNFESLVFINDSLLVACRRGSPAGGDSLFVINEGISSMTFFSIGYDPVSVAPDTFICVERVDGRGFAVIRHHISGNTEDTLFSVASGNINGTLRWPVIDSPSNRMVLSIISGDSIGLYTTETGAIPDNDKNTVPAFIGTTLSSKAYILDYNLIIYTGPDGRFYQCKFDGSSKLPFWATLERK